MNTADTKHGSFIYSPTSLERFAVQFGQKHGFEIRPLSFREQWIEGPSLTSFGFPEDRNTRLIYRRYPSLGVKERIEAEAAANGGKYDENLIIQLYEDDEPRKEEVEIGGDNLVEASLIHHSPYRETPIINFDKGCDFNHIIASLQTATPNGIYTFHAGEGEAQILFTMTPRENARAFTSFLGSYFNV